MTAWPEGAELAALEWLRASDTSVSVAELQHLAAKAPEAFGGALEEVPAGEIDALCALLSERAGRPIERGDFPFLAEEAT